MEQQPQQPVTASTCPSNDGSRPKESFAIINLLGHPTRGDICYLTQSYISQVDPLLTTYRAKVTKTNITEHRHPPGSKHNAHKRPGITVITDSTMNYTRKRKDTPCPTHLKTPESNRADITLKELFWPVTSAGIEKDAVTARSLALLVKTQMPTVSTRNYHMIGW